MSGKLAVADFLRFGFYLSGDGLEPVVLPSHGEGQRQPAASLFQRRLRHQRRQRFPVPHLFHPGRLPASRRHRRSSRARRHLVGHVAVEEARRRRPAHRQKHQLLSGTEPIQV